MKTQTEQKRYIVMLRKDKQKELELFTKYYGFFKLEEAKDYIEFFNRLYPHNKGYYKILLINEETQ